MALLHHMTLTLPHRSTLARDNVQMSMTWAMETDWTAAEFTAAEADVTSFFNSTATGAGSTNGSKLSPSISRTIAPTFRWYDIDGLLGGGPAGSPVRVQPMALLPAAASSPLPAEVAIVIGWQADYGADVEFGAGTRPRSRDRNRTYFGPLCVNTIATDSADSHGKVAANVINDLGLAFQQYILRAASGPHLVVWSRKAAAVKNVVQATIDDAFDTQRRRGERRTSVTSFTVA